MKFLFLTLLFPFFLIAAEVKIITDLYPVYILIHDIIKDSPAKIDIISESDEDLHDHGFGLKIKDLNAIKHSNLLVSYCIKKCKGIVDKDRYIDLSKHLEIIKDNNNTEDLHFWLNPENGLKIVHLVAQKLAKIDKKNKSIYLNNANRISDSINEEVNSIRNSLKQDSFVNGDYLVLHDAYRYFEKFFNIKRPYGYFYDNNHNMICFNKTEDYRKKMKNNDIKCLIVNQRENNISRNFKNCVKIVYINPLGREIGVNLDNGYTRLLHSVYLGYKECLMK